MIYLTTGANGAGKTLLTLKDVREQQLKENRPVYYHGFEMEPAKAAEFGWQEFDPKKWQDLPDGSICIMDECQNEFPLRRPGSDVPDYVNAVAQFRRKRGFDFWMVCPHPSLIDVSIRRLIDKPSWHRHIKRAFGADVVSELKFGSPDLKCESPGAGQRGEVKMRAFPKEVYSWYRSASLHTGKKKIPRAVYVLAACAVAVPAALYFAVTGVYNNATKSAQKGIDPAASAGTGLSAPKTNEERLIKVSAEDWLLLRKSRLPEFPHTAPVYDDVTKPTTAPYPAACVQSKDKCKCYTQQATIMAISLNTCQQIVASGYFMDWQEQRQTQQPQQRQVSQPQPYRMQPAYSEQQQDATPDWSTRMQQRNANVVSSLKR